MIVELPRTNQTDRRFVLIEGGKVVKVWKV